MKSENKGLKKGLKEGKEEGLKEGKEQGLKEGKDKGKEEGLKEGKDEGIHKVSFKQDHTLAIIMITLCDFSIYSHQGNTTKKSYSVRLYIILDPSCNKYYDLIG